MSFFIVRFRNVVDRKSNWCWWSSKSFRIVSCQRLVHLPVLFFFCCHVDYSSQLTPFKKKNSVNTVVPGSKVLSTATSIAQQITANSPDAVQSTKVGLLLSQKHNFAETFTTHAWSPESRRVYKGANIKVFSYLLFPWLKGLHSPCWFYRRVWKLSLRLVFFFISIYLLVIPTRGLFAWRSFYFVWYLISRNVLQGGRILQSCKNKQLLRKCRHQRLNVSTSISKTRSQRIDYFFWAISQGGSDFLQK